MPRARAGICSRGRGWRRSERNEMSLIISFQGFDADDHHVEAFAGARSIAGISRSLALVANYASTGSVRYRYPFNRDLQFFIEGTAPGSFNWKFVLVGIGGPLALGLGTNAIYDLGKLVIGKATGQEITAIAPEIRDLNARRGGDIEALVEASEPALKEAHYGIGPTIGQIVIINGDNRAPLIALDENTKEYLNTSIPTGVTIQDVSVAALNANDKTGRIFLFDIGRTVAFKISSEATPRTIVNLSRGLEQYARGTGATVEVRFQTIEAVDGRIKRVIIYDARFVESDDR